MQQCHSGYNQPKNNIIFIILFNTIISQTPQKCK